MCTIFVGLFLLLISGLTSGQSFNCPVDPNDIPNCIEDLYPYAYDCEYYWSCTSACIDYLLSCPPGLHFNPNNDNCDTPINVGCVETTTGNPVTTTTTTQTTTTPTSTDSTTAAASTTAAPLVNPAIFFAGRTSGYTGTIDYINFQSTTVDRHGDFDGTYFVAPTTGYYFFNFNVGLTNGRQTNFRLQGPTDVNVVNVRRYSYSHNALDQTSRDYIFYLNEGQIIWMEQTLGSGGFSSTAEGMETSFGGFSLHDSMENPSLFSVATDAPSSSLGIIDFNIVSTNYGSSWDSVNNRYIAPVAGTYFFSMSAGTPPNNEVRLALTVDGVTVAELLKDHANNNGDDTFSRSLVINLLAGQAVQSTLLDGSLWSNGRLQTSLTGYQINPYYTPTVAWSVHKTSNWGGASILDPVDYEEVFVNEQNVYNTGTHLVTIPYDGFYYVHLGVGAVSQSPTFLRLYVSSSTTDLFRLRRESTNHVGTDTLSRGGIFYFYTGDQLRVQSPSGYEFAAGSANQRLTSFQGFLIYSNQ